MAIAKRATPSIEHLIQKFPKHESPVVLVDAGHGGVIDGVYQTDPSFDINKPGSYTKGYVHSPGKGIMEGEFNRDVMERALFLADKIGLPYEVVTKGQEDIPLRERSSFINDYYYNVTKECYVASIHANAGKGTGKEIFTSPGLTDADPLAEIMIGRIHQFTPNLRLRSDDSDGDHDKEARFHMVTRTIPPAFLIECGFMDTLEPDFEFMMSDEGRDTFAKAIFYGFVDIAEYWNKK